MIMDAWLAQTLQGGLAGDEDPIPVGRLLPTPLLDTPAGAPAQASSSPFLTGSAFRGLPDFGEAEGASGLPTFQGLKLGKNS